MRRTQGRRWVGGSRKSPLRKFEHLESRELLDATGHFLGAANARHIPYGDFVKDINWSTSDVNASFMRAGRTRDLVFTPTIVGGSSDGEPADSPSNAIDPNVPAGGVYGGVAHIKILIPNFPARIPGTNPQQFDENNLITAEFSCTGSVVAPTYVLTAAHCFDALNEVDPVIDLDAEINPGGLNPGNGIFDPGTTAEVQLNDGDPAGDGLFSSVHTVSSVIMHPSFEGFMTNQNDDLALLELSSPVPVGTPIYAITDSIISDLPSQRINMVGYGLTGSGDTGLITDPTDPDYRSPEVKRQRQNIADLFADDDETFPFEISPGVFINVPVGPDEIFIYDFDGPTGDGFLGGETLGNDVEGNVAPGDSGGPSFLMDGDGELLTDSLGRPIIGGINTFNGAFGFGGDPGQFVSESAPVGGLSGGVMLGPYADWIHSHIGVDLALSSNITVGAAVGSDTTVTYELDLTNNGANDATSVVIEMTQLDLPSGATFSVEGATTGFFFLGRWIVGNLAASETETLTLSIEFDPTTTNPGDPLDVSFAVLQVTERDVDDSNDFVSDSVPLDAPFAATISGSSWVVNPVPLNVGANGTLSWGNLDTFTVTYPVEFAEAPAVEVYGPTDGADPIVATLGSFDGLTAEYTVPKLDSGYYKIVANGTEIDFSVLPGDVNGSSNVDIFDFSDFISDYSPGEFQGLTPLPEDFNGTGTVDIFDFSIFISHYLTDLSAFTPPTVPPPPAPAEPASVAVVDAVWASVAEVDDDDEEIDDADDRRQRRRRRG